MKLLIPNATGPTNTGDQAILAGLILLIEKNFDHFDLIIHSSTPEKYQNYKYPVKPHLYHWAVFDRPEAATRLYRIFQLSVQCLFSRLRLRLPIGPKQLIELVDDYRNADLIIFAGGGYLRTNPGVRQSLNLLMILLHFVFAKIFTARVIAAPLSFGPFAKKWQEALSARVLNKLECVGVRENISYTTLSKYGTGNLIISADHALLLARVDPPQPKDKLALGFTVRNWNGPQATAQNAQIITEAIINFVQITDLAVQPIVQADSLEYGDEDSAVTAGISAALAGRGLDVKKTITIHGVEQAIRTYNQIDMVLGMRMHSNIIATTQLKPFLAIAYEHKTRGISRMLDSEAYCLDYGDFTANELSALLVKLYKNRFAVAGKIKSKLSEIRETEHAKWQKIFKTKKSPRIE